MLIQMRRLQLETPAVGSFEEDAPLRLDAFDRRLARLGRIAAAALRLLVLLTALLMLANGISGAAGLALWSSFILAVAALAAGWHQSLPRWIALLGDGAAIGLLLIASGSSASPLLPLALLLIAQGALAGGARDALAGGGIGVVVLLLVALADGLGSDQLIGALIVLEIVAGSLIAWMWAHGSATITALREQLGRADSLAGMHNDTRRAIEWQRLNQAQISGTTNLAELVRCITQRATQIAAVPAAVYLAGEPAVATSRRSTHLPINTMLGTGSIVVESATSALSSGQMMALEQLADLAGRHADALHAAEQLRRQQDALTTLWQVSGVVRTAPEALPMARDACRRMAEALDLDWLALLAPDATAALVPLLLVRGGVQQVAPRLQGSQLRVAAEALRGGRPLVRSEGQAVLFCIPLTGMHDTPLLLVARGAADEAGIQALLMVFGGMLAERL